MDEEEPKPRFPDWPPKTLDHLSLDALEAYGQALQVELARVKRTIESRAKQRNAADSIFKR